MLIVVGTNHKYSPLKLRERLSFSQSSLREALLFLSQADVFKGGFILSTCNRVEIYVSTEESERAIAEIEAFFSRYHEIEIGRISPYLYRYIDKQAMRHLFLLVCGLDSLILGEKQILGQVKSAFSEAKALGFVDGFLRDIFYSAVSFAKRIHSQTKIAQGKVSVGSVAIDFIKERTGRLSGKNIIIIGVGKVSELVLRHLKKENPNVIFVTNRTFKKAEELAAQIGATAVRYDRLGEFLSQADILITMTASPHFIIKKEMLGKIMAVRSGISGRKLLIIDLALPRDVEPAAGEIENVVLFTLEDLDTVIKKNMRSKIQEAEKVNKIVDLELDRLWVKLTASEPGLAPLHLSR